MTVLQLSNGNYKDFSALQVAYEMKHGKDDISQQIFSTSVNAGLHGYTKREERATIYRTDGPWIKLIEKAGL